jgi:hypothetical protein
VSKFFTPERRQSMAVYLSMMFMPRKALGIAL